MNTLQILSQLPGLQWLTPISTKSYTLHPGVYKGVSFYVYSLDGKDYMARTRGGSEVVITNPVTNLENIVTGVW
jgi:hypothetical protein